MNDSSRLNSQVLNRDATLNTLMYLGGYYSHTKDGTSVNIIISNVNNSINSKINSFVSEGHTLEEAQSKYADDIRKTRVIENAIKNDPSIGRLVIANQTTNMRDPSTGNAYEAGGLSACTFQDKLSNPSEVTVVFRGTGPGEWYDNGLGLSGETVGTDQQIQATEYFDSIVEKNKWDGDSSPNIYITGHSKGGNKTQFVVMTSEYSSLIIGGYSLDGQCMSQEAIDYMKQKYGEDEYNKRRNKLFSISADNDYVNVLGSNNKDGRIIPNENIYYLKSNMTGVSWHYPDCYMNEDGDTLTSFTEQGAASQFIQGVSEATMGLPVPIRSIITNGAMAIAEMALGNGTPVNGESFSYADICASVPLLLEMLPAGVIETLGNQLGINLDWLANTVTAAELLIFAPINIAAYGIGATIDLLLELKDKIVEFGSKCKDITTKIVAFIETGISKLKSWFERNFNAGYKYANSNPSVTIDTYKLRTYAQRLQAVNRRISNLDSRLDRLYGSVGLKDLWNLIQADILTGYSWRISRCISYLYDTANDFDNAENSISGNL